ncbi:MAG: hypothetical protein KC476_08595 [Cyanobacteria bacterium HKST-UBA06]|nr:hypothetical protein [Cyanobacteria bacterium HKST-UBA06]
MVFSIGPIVATSLLGATEPSADFKAGQQAQANLQEGKLDASQAPIVLAGTTKGRLEGIRGYAAADWQNIAMARFDKNGDGKLSGNELTGIEYMLAADLNGDGAVDVNEHRAMIAFQTNPKAYAQQAIPGLPKGDQASATEYLDLNIEAAETQESIKRHQDDHKTDHQITPTEAILSLGIMSIQPELAKKALALANEEINGKP